MAIGRISSVKNSYTNQNPTVNTTIASGGTESTYVGNGVNGIDGVTYKVHTFTADSSLIVTQTGKATVLCVGPGCTTSSNGNGGPVIVSEVDLPIGTHSVVIGVSETSQGAGGDKSTRLGSIVGAGVSLTASDRGNDGVSATSSGVVSLINGTSREYGAGGSRKSTLTNAADRYGIGGDPSISNRAGGGVVIVRYPINLNNITPESPQVSAYTGTYSTYTSNNITYDVYSYTGSGSITFAYPGFVDMVLVGGGGGGHYGSGGGSGQVLQLSGNFLTAGSYTVTVGGGGSAGGVSGFRSSVGTIMAVGGGGAGYANTSSGYGQSGGSGGGGGGGDSNSGTGGVSLCGQGNGGGTIYYASGGGGGGAGGNGGNWAAPANGGPGVAVTISGSSVTYGGGGAGGSFQNGGATGGSGGGGNGGTGSGGTAGSANTGGGGGGNWTAGKAGGSGTVIIRVIRSNRNARSSVVASGGTESTYTGNGTNGISGQNYKVHTFTGSSTFTMTQGGFVDCLVVAGGAGGSGEWDNCGAGGGGAGGMIEKTGVYLNSGTYTVTVASGGSGGVGGTSSATNGGSSSIGFIQAVGGGAGAGSFSSANNVLRSRPYHGGSGGGTGYTNSNIGLGVPGQGNNGGTTAGYGCAGGGGAGGVGANGTGNAGANGGIGLISFMNGTSTYYAGGGAGGGASASGGAGGLGGGGNGGNSSNGTDGTVNTGGGGGGSGQSTASSVNRNGGNGGSGIVIIRYAT
jgi:hypothetical protein